MSHVSSSDVGSIILNRYMRLGRRRGMEVKTRLSIQSFFGRASFDPGLGPRYPVRTFLAWLVCLAPSPPFSLVKINAACRCCLPTSESNLHP